MANAAGHTPALPSEKRLFNAFELRLFRYTAVLLSLVVLTTLAGIVVWSLGWVLKTFYNLLLSLAVAGVLALVLDPLVVFFERRLRFPRLLAIIVLLLVFFVAFAGLLISLVPTLVSQAIELMTVLPDKLASWWEYLSFYYPELSSMISNTMESSGAEESQSVLPGLQDTGSTIMSYVGVLAAISFVPLFLFFALLSGDSLREKVSELLSVFHKPTQKKSMYFMDVFVGYVTAFFQGQLIIAVAMGGLYAMSFTLIGLEFGVLVGLVLGLLNIVPFLVP